MLHLSIHTFISFGKLSLTIPIWQETDQLNSKRQQDKKQGKISEVHPGASSNPENVVCETKFDKFVNTAR